MQNLTLEVGKRESIPVVDFLSRAPITWFSMSFAEATPQAQQFYPIFLFIGRRSVQFDQYLRIFLEPA
ncbi:MAG: hypothetical protein CMM01_04650 [Rhodopirellula sp.]|nr:hypothetical protein [Rhodopirellula sp.]